MILEWKAKWAHNLQILELKNETFCYKNPNVFKRRRQIKSQFSSFWFKHSNTPTYLGWTFATNFFSALYHPPVSSVLACWEHGECDGIATDFSPGFCQCAIPSQFRRDSINSTDFPWIQRNLDGYRVSISPCSPHARTELTFSSWASWGW